MGLWEFTIKEKVSKILDALLGSHIMMNCLSMETHLRNQLGHDAGAVNIKKYHQQDLVLDQKLRERGWPPSPAILG